MARETKAQRQAREAAEQAMFEEVARATYVPRMMQVLELAQSVNFELMVSASQFTLTDKDNWYDYFTVEPVYSATADEKLEELNYAVQYKLAEQRQREEKHAMRLAALAKLSKSERELLGLTD